MELTMKKFARLAGLGAFAVSFGVVGLYLLIGIGGGQTGPSAIDATNRVLVWLGAGVPAAAIAAAHLVYGFQLMKYAKDHQA